MKRQQKSTWSNITVLIILPILLGTAISVLGQPKIEIVSLPSATSDINRAIFLKPDTFGESALIIGTSKGKAMFSKMKADDISLKPPFLFKPFTIQTNGLIREIGFFENRGYLLGNDGIYFSDTKTAAWNQRVNTNESEIKKGFTSTAELWGMSFADDSRVCIAGVYFKNNGEDIDRELLLCTNNIWDNQIKWNEPKKPGSRKNELLQFTNIYFDKKTRKGWVVGTDGAEGIIWESDDDGVKWEEQKSTIEEPLLGVAGMGNKAIAVGYNGLVIGKGVGAVNVLPTLDTKIEEDDRVRLKGSILTTLRLDQLIGITGKVKKINGNIVEIKDWEVTPKEIEKIAVEALKRKTIRISDVEKIRKEEENIDKFIMNWTKIAVPLKSNQITLRSVKFSSNGEEGFIVGNSGTILYTQDGGASWKQLTTVIPTQQTQLNTVDFYSIFVDDSYCWIAGSKGTIVRIKLARQPVLTPNLIRQ